ncbi:MAG: hypothetical protein IT518_00345 [Burkholderiales bacterium]|nr:hypothetical protein [Burkholderiales bacterium]
MSTLAPRIRHAIVAFGCAAALLAAPGIDAQSGRWVATGSLNVPRYDHAATLLADGSVLVVGGRNRPTDGNALAGAERYDPVTGMWRVVASPSFARDRPTATLLLDGKVLVVGGRDRPEIYDPVTDTWSIAAGTAVAPFGHTATRLANGKVLVFRDTIDFSVPFTPEIYDPATGQWTAAGNPRSGRYGHTATLLVDGTVLVAGGISNDYGYYELPEPQMAEIYDPATNGWREVGNPIRIYNHTATLLRNGEVLIAGGFANVVDSQATLVFDRTSGLWRPVGRLHAPRLGHTATLLTSDKVLIAGSAALRGTAVNTAVETYDPGNEQFTSTSPLGIGRQSHTATPLANGNVLVAGGMAHAGDEFAVRGTAELFVPGFDIVAGLSGAWYDPAQSGHGLFIEVLRDTDCDHGTVSFNSKGYGVGSMSLTRLTQPLGLRCP